MNVIIGKKGVGNSWQEPFKKNVKCHKCGHNCRLMFVASEFERKPKDGFVCNLHENTGNGETGKYWPHDAIACAVYLCEKCFEPNAIINQA